MPLACGIIRLPGRGLEALPTLGRLRDGLSQWRNRLPRVSRERLARVYEGGFASSDREPQSQASGAQGPEWLPKFDYYLDRSEEHTSEFQSPCNLVCRLLLEKKTRRYTVNTYRATAHSA